MKARDAERREAFIQGYVEALKPKTPREVLMALPAAEKAYDKWRRSRE